MDKEIKNPKTGNMIKVRTALQLPDEHPANKRAKKMVAKTSIDKGDVGGPAYPNVPKGAKTSKQAKEFKKETLNIKKEIEDAPSEVKSWYEKNIGTKIDKVITYVEDIQDWYGDPKSDFDKFPKFSETETRATENVNESKKRRYTVKEVRMWMKKLEENRYKKVYNSDARRVAWMVNNEGVSLDEMPISMKKKWTKKF